MIHNAFGGQPQAYLSERLLEQEIGRSFKPPAGPSSGATADPVPQRLLIQALAAASGSDASQATATLAALHSLDLAGDIRTAATQALPTPSTAAAWKLATALAARPGGMAVLNSVLKNPVKDKAQQADVALVLETLVLLRGEKQRALTPVHLLQDPALRGSWAGMAAVGAIRRMAGGGEPAAAKQPAVVPPAAVSHPLLNTVVQEEPAMASLVESQFGTVAQAGLSKMRLSRALQQWRGAVTAAPPMALPGLAPTLLVQALASATGSHAAAAVEALAALRQLDPSEALAAAWRNRLAPAPTAPAAQTAAWTVAAELATTPSGMEVLQSVVARPVAPQHREDVALLLKALRALGSGLSPETVLRNADLKDDIAAQAVACVAARLADRPNEAHVYRWALGAVGNDLYKREAGSDWAFIEKRIRKWGVWIDRAEGNDGKVRNALINKSAFRALSMGIQQVERGPVSRHTAAYEKALRSTAQALQTPLLTLAPLLRLTGSAGREGAEVPPDLLKAVVLEHCLALPPTVSMDRYALADAALEDLQARLNVHLTSAATPDGAVPLQPLLPQIQALAGAQMNFEILSQWVDAAELSLSRRPAVPAPRESALTEASTSLQPAVAASPTEQPDASIQQARAGLQTAFEEAYGRDTRMPTVTREALRALLHDIVANIEGSSRLRLASGGVAGLSLRQLTAALSALATGATVRVRLDLKLQGGRQAIFEIAMPPYDMEIVMATQQQVAHQTGVGGSAGPEIEGVLGIGPNIDAVLHAKENASWTGISIRLPRVGRPMPELRAEFSKLVDRLIDGTARGGAGEQDSLLKALLQEFPKLTVNVIDSAGDSRRRRGASAEVGAFANAGFVRGTAAAGVSVEKHRKVTRHYRDAIGRMRVEREIIGATTRVNVGARASAGANTSTAPVSFSSGNTSLGFGISADVVSKGSYNRAEAVYELGRLHPISFREVEEHSLNVFLEKVDGEKEEWVQARVAAPGKVRNADEERVNLEAFLNKLREQAQPTHTYGIRRTIKPDAAARIDAYRSVSILAERSGQDTAAFEAAINAIWSDAESFQPYSLRSYERAADQKTTGLPPIILGHLNGFHSAEANHINNRFDVA